MRSPHSKLACVDVDYQGATAVAACVLFDDWEAKTSTQQFVEVVSPVEPYIPGQFYRRELPCILKVLGKLSELPEVIVVDGYVWLGNETKPGLGAHLHHALNAQATVIGVSKNRFLNAAPVTEIIRGASKRPLFISAAGMNLIEAEHCIKVMDGENRIPTMLRLVDRLCRTAVANSASHNP